jgi:hypothetical protein
MLQVLPPRIDVVIALAVGSTWGFLSVVFLTQPDPFQPIALIDYVAVVSFSVALAVLAPAAWLISKVAGRAMALHRHSAVAALGAATLFRALMFQDGGLGVAIAAWLVAGVAMWRGLGYPTILDQRARRRASRARCLLHLPRIPGLVGSPMQPRA